MNGYLLFHVLVELFSIITAWSMLAVAWNSRNFVKHSFFLFLGVAYAAVGTVDLFHTLAYQGMGVFPGVTANLATQLWIAGRYLNAGSLLLAPVFLDRRLRAGWIVLPYVAVTTATLITVFNGWWPDCYRENPKGLTAFKIGSEYAVCALVAVAMRLLWQRRAHFDGVVLRLLLLSMGLTIAAELAFTLYVDVYGHFNMLGHLLKVASFTLLFVAITVTGLQQPYRVLFHDLQENEERYRSLFSNMTEGFALYEIIPDAEGRPGDYRFLEVNPAFEQLIGFQRTELLGRSMKRLVSDSEASWLKNFDRVALTGRPMHFISHTVELGRWHDVFAYPSASNQLAVVFTDITERKRTDEALRQSESDFRLLSETAGRLLTAPEPRRVVNDLCREVMAHLDCQAFINYLADSDAGKLHLNAYAGIPEETARKIEWLDYGAAVCGCAARDGVQIVADDIFRVSEPRTDLVKSCGIEAYASHPLMAEGRVIGTLSFGTKTRTSFSPQDLALMRTVTDQVATAVERIRLIGELKKSRDELEMRVRERTAELLKANEQISDLYHNAPCGYHSLGPDGTFLRINDTELKWLGYTRKELIGKKKWSDLLTPDSRVRFEMNFPIFRERGWINDLEYEVIRKDGTTLPVVLNATAVMDGKGKFVLSRSTIFDITERKRAEEQVRKRQALLQSVFDGISDPLLMLNKSLSVMMLNEAAREYFGVAEGEDVAVKTCSELAPEKRGPCDCCVVSEVISESTKKTFERKGLINPERIEEVTVYPVGESASGIAGAVIRISDITESKNMEKQLTRADRLSSMGVLAGGIAHEIRNPLYAMSLFVDVLRDEEKFSLGSQELNILQELKTNIKRIEDIIRRVLDFSREVDNTSQRLDVGALIEQSLQLWKSSMVKSGIKLGLSIEEHLPEVFGDAIEIQQVLTNLVQNAVEAMEHNGALDIIAQSGTLSFDGKRPAVIIKVRDSGPGIPPDQQKNIFNPFFTTKYAGTGLGLAISQRIIFRHGGLISFESVPEEGTTFAVELPGALEG